MTRRSPGSPTIVAIAGCGRAGSALAAALARTRVLRVRVWDRDGRRAARTARISGARREGDLAALLPGAGLLLIAVSDEALAAFARRLRRAWPATGGPDVVLHVSGSQGAEALFPLRGSVREPDRAPALGVFHPAASLLGADSAAALRGAWATVSGDAAAVRAGRRLARAVGLQAIHVRDDARPLVHLAATLAAGDLVTLLATAEGLLSRAGAPATRAKAVVTRLAATALDNYSRVGAAAGLTGPVARGDVATLRRHFEALDPAGGVDGAVQVHAALVVQGARLLHAAGRINRATCRRLLRCARRAMLPGRRRPRTLARKGADRR